MVHERGVDVSSPEIIVVEKGFVVDPVHYSPPNQPQSLDQPR
jgi:hypothetical protein